MTRYELPSDRWYGPASDEAPGGDSDGIDVEGAQPVGPQPPRLHGTDGWGNKQVVV